ncbi:LysR family transcriptional regulator, partial [Burkholderia pseudomallei]|uniref:LysR family transcriptional regulator n=1 Tax=Burkholderia pseudomallei TaxID=28450 RepID=UPI002AB43047
MIDRSGEMEIFVAAVREGSLSAAARRLDLTPSAVSRALARIEARLGVRLITRTTRRLVLTTEGDAYLHAAQRILADIAEMEGELADQAAPRS